MERISHHNAKKAATNISGTQCPGTSSSIAQSKTSANVPSTGTNDNRDKNIVHKPKVLPYPYADMDTELYQQTDIEADDWEATLADLHRAHFDRKYEKVWETLYVHFTNEDVYSALLYLIDTKSIDIHNSYYSGSIETFLVLYIADAVNELIEKRYFPSAMNEVIINYQSAAAEDEQEDDFVAINIGTVLPRVFDVLLSRIVFKNIGVYIKTGNIRDQLSPHCCNTLFNVAQLLKGKKATPHSFTSRMLAHQTIFTEESLTDFAIDLCRHSVPYDLYMLIMIFLSYAN